MGDGSSRNGAQRVPFRWREALAFTPGLDMYFGELTTGDRTYRIGVSGDPHGPGVNCGFWDETTPDLLERIAARMRARLQGESDE